MLNRKPRKNDKITNENGDIFLITRVDGDLAFIGKETEPDYSDCFIWQFKDGMNTYFSYLEA